MIECDRNNEWISCKGESECSSNRVKLCFYKMIICEYDNDDGVIIYSMIKLLIIVFVNDKLKSFFEMKWRAEEKRDEGTQVMLNIQNIIEGT